MFELSQEDKNLITEIHDNWIEAELKSDLNFVLQLCTEDVHWMIPHADILVGKAAAKDLLNEPGIKLLQINTEKIEIRGNGCIAYKTCQYHTRFLIEATQEEEIAEGCHLWILHKLENIGWKVAFVTWQPSS